MGGSCKLYWYRFRGVIIPFIISKFRLIRLIRLGLIGLLITDGASLFIIEVEWFMSIRFLSGIAGGLIYATVLAGLAGIVKPERGFGIYVVVYCCWSGIGLFLSPYLLGVLGVAGVFLFLLFTTLLALIFSSSINAFNVNINSGSAIKIKSLLGNRNIIAALLAYLSFRQAAVPSGPTSKESPI